MFSDIKKNRLLVNFFKISSGTLVSRITGFIRELVVAFYFGTTKYMDAFVYAFTIPNLFRRILGEDMVERGLMPPVKAFLAKNEKDKASSLVSALFNIMFVILIILMLLMYIAAPILVKLIAPAVEKETFDIILKFTYVILPFMVFIGMAAFAGGLLNILEMNIVYSFAPVMLSIGVIVSLVFLQPVFGYFSLTAGFLLGALLQFLVQVPFLLKKRVKEQTGLSYRLHFSIEDRSRKKIKKESIYIALQSILNKSVELVDKILASFLLTGSISGLYYSQRLVQLPNAIIGLAISRSITPYLTEKNAVDNLDDFKKGILYGIKFNLSIILPITALAIILRHEIIYIIYKRGDFTLNSVLLTSLPFWCHMIGLPAMSLNFLFSRGFSAIQRNKIPFYTAVFATLLNIILSIILVKTQLKHGGLALSSSIAFTLNTFVLYIMLNRFLGEKGVPIRLNDLLKPVLKIILGTAIFSVLVFFTSDFIKNSLYFRENFTDFSLNLIIVCLTSAVGFLFYIIFNYILKKF